MKKKRIDRRTDDKQPHLKPLAPHLVEREHYTSNEMAGRLVLSPRGIVCGASHTLMRDFHVSRALLNNKLIFQEKKTKLSHAYEIHHKTYLKRFKYLLVNSSSLLNCEGKEGFPL